MESRRLDRSIYFPYSQLVADFVDRSTNLNSTAIPFSSESLIDLSKRRDFDNEFRATLFQEIRDQYKESGIALEASSPVFKGIEALSQENTYTLVTGHQLCIFTGPLFFPIKILQVLKMAEEINASQSEIHIVPIYWMASEDHDFPEIDHVNLFNKSLRWEGESGGAVGEIACDGMSKLLDEMAQIMGDSEYARELLSLFQKAYASGNDLARATRILVHGLFEERGLVVIDANRPVLKSAFRRFMVKEVEEGWAFRTVSETNETLEGYKLQVNPREVNLFYLLPGERLRIDKEGKGFQSEDAKYQWTLEELKAEIGDHPERFSPNVLLRPLYQEVILPNLAYVGGPGEIAYWLQLTGLFKEGGVSFPLLSLRNSVVWMDSGKQKKLDKLGLAVEDLFLNEAEVTKKLIGFSEDDEEIRSEIESVKESFGRMAGHFEAVDPSLKAFVLAESRKAEKQLEQLSKRLIKVKKDKNKEGLDRFWSLSEKVFPKGQLHERYDNFVPYYLKHGPAFFQVLYEQMDASDPRICLVSE